MKGKTNKRGRKYQYDADWIFSWMTILCNPVKTMRINLHKANPWQLIPVEILAVRILDRQIREDNSLPDGVSIWLGFCNGKIRRYFFILCSNYEKNADTLGICWHEMLKGTLIVESSIPSRNCQYTVLDWKLGISLPSWYANYLFCLKSHLWNITKVFF